MNVNTVKVTLNQAPTTSPSSSEGQQQPGSGLTFNPKALVTKFKIQWSFDESFSDLKGERIFNCECGTAVVTSLTNSTDGKDGADAVKSFEATIPGFIRYKSNPSSRSHPSRSAQKAEQRFDRWFFVHFSGQSYYVRAAFGNLKGYGSYCSADTNPVVPSTWRALNQALPRFQNQNDITARILDKVRLFKCFLCSIAQEWLSRCHFWCC